MGAEFGQALGETIVGGVRLFNAAHQYLFNIGFTGDYSKPFRDIVELGNAMNEKWDSLPLKEQERIKFKLLTELGADTLIGGAGMHSAGKAGKFTEFLDDIADEMAKQGAKTLEGAKKRAKTIKEGLEDLMLPEAVTPDGQRIKIRTHRETPDNAVYSQAHNPGRFDLPHAGDPPERASDRLSGRPEEPSPVRTGGRSNERPSESPSERPPRQGSHQDSSPESDHSPERPDRNAPEGDALPPRNMRAEIQEALELLDQPLVEILKQHKVRIEIIEKMEDVYPNDPIRKRYMGAYDWPNNTVYIPEKVWHGGELIDNFDLDFAIRHEIGHVYNAKTLERANAFYPTPVRISETSPEFLQAFKKDFEAVPADILHKLGFKNTPDGLKCAQDEVFADTFAHLTGFPTKSEWSRLIKKHFGSTLEFMEANVDV